MHCALSADLPRPRAKRDVNGNEKFLWSLVYYWSALRKDQSSRDLFENLARKQRTSFREISDEINFVAITYLISYLNYSFHIRG